MRRVRAVVALGPGGLASVEVRGACGERAVVSSEGFDGVGLVGIQGELGLPEGADAEELQVFLEAAVGTYLEHVEEHGDASGLLPVEEA